MCSLTFQWILEVGQVMDKRERIVLEGSRLEHGRGGCRSGGEGDSSVSRDNDRRPG